MRRGWPTTPKYQKKPVNVASQITLVWASLGFRFPKVVQLLLMFISIVTYTSLQGSHLTYRYSTQNGRMGDLHLVPIVVLGYP